MLGLEPTDVTRGVVRELRGRVVGSYTTRWSPVAPAQPCSLTLTARDESGTNIIRPTDRPKESDTKMVRPYSNPNI